LLGKSLVFFMKTYRLAGQEIHFPGLVPETAPFEITSNEKGTVDEAVPFIPILLALKKLIARTEGWVANAQRRVEIWSASAGFLLRTEGGSDFTISPDGHDIRCASQGQCDGELDETDRQILLGPVIVLALALRGTWSLHASAAIYKDALILFLGESRQGKSTLASYLANEAGWWLAADDILPVTMGADGVTAWPRFPQLKLPVDAQPGVGLPDQLPINKVCVLSDAGEDEMPALERLPASQAIQAFLGHTAGTRLFTPELLGKHLAFCSQAAERVPVYRLIYPHRWDVLPIVKDLLEKTC
jgi:hypothetical protein